MGVIVKNGIAYTGANILKQPIIYSTDEREVGVWIDGKPLYQKTVIDDTERDGSVSTTQTLYTGISNMDIVVSFEGFVSFANNSSWLPMIFTDNEGFSFTQSLVKICRIGTNGNIGFQIGNNYNESNKINRVIATLQYTKTTDTAGSGIWTPSGIPAVHYDGNEKVIGTWFGETLYEKTIVTDFLNSSASDVLRPLSIDITNLDDIKNIDGFWKIENYGNVVPINLYHTSDYRTVMEIYPDDNIIGYMFSWGTTRGKLYLTIQYTKTT